MRRILTTLRRLYGLPCWGVEPSFFPSLMLQFGRPHLRVREPYKSQSAFRNEQRRAARRMVRAHGEWALWLWCCHWTVFDGSRVIGDSTTKRRIDRAARYLNGQKLVNFQLSVRSMRTTFEFDLGGKLETKPFDRKREQWILYGPDGKVLTIRADKRYCYGPGDRTPDRERWLAIDA